ncbi:MAG: hypothetical protein KJ600_01440 [Nanoarchaeota archaeon]|nr:hypothetical protein [Nanoarchaeota archaeon]MBU1103203.1 hypothetical protein [Nanoarchaeota archaeon]
MTQEIWPKKPKLSRSKDVCDIVQFGSSIIEGAEPNDVDVAVIYNKIPLKEQLNQSQKIKEQLQKSTNKPVHIKSFDFYSLFDKSNFAKESILFGKSLLDKKYFANRLGLIPKVQIFYNLQKLKKNEKIKFNYLLSGKKGEYGLLRKHGGKLLKPSLIEIAPEKEKIFADRIQKLTKEFEVKKIFYS